MTSNERGGKVDEHDLNQIGLDVKPKWIDMNSELQKLIDEASKKVGSDSKLAQLINANQQHISQWRKGLRPCPPADVALMAEIAGYDAIQWIAKAEVWKHQGTPKGEALARALGKALAGGMVATMTTTASATVFGMIDESLKVLRCILSDRIKVHV